MNLNEIYLGDALELMTQVSSKTVNMILCDLPYQKTQNKWDSLIDLNKMWYEFTRVIKDNGAIVLTGKQPFTSIVITSNLPMYKYNLVWRKNLKSNNLNARKMPMGAYEDIMVFYKNPPTYNPQQIPRTFQIPSGNKHNSKTTNYGKQKEDYIDRQSDWLMPDDVIDYEDAYSLDALDLENEMLYIKCLHNSKGKIHPTQKPVELFEWLIKSYTNENDVVLDCCVGSGTTAIAAMLNNRHFIVMEKDEDIYNSAKNRIDKFKNSR